MGNIFYFQWEIDLIAWLQQVMGKAGSIAAKVMSFIGGETFMLLLMIVMLFCYRKESGKRVALTVLTAGMWFPMIKNVVLRIRPYMAHQESIKVLQVTEADADPMDIIQQGFSFPSGHSATSVAMFGSIARELRKKWMWTVAAAMALLIGLSRIAVGVHYPTDVLAGWAVGLAAVGFCALCDPAGDLAARDFLVHQPGLFHHAGPADRGGSRVPVRSKAYRLPGHAQHPGNDPSLRRRAGDLLCAEHGAENALQQGIPGQRNPGGKPGADSAVRGHPVCRDCRLSESFSVA